MTAALAGDLEREAAALLQGRKLRAAWEAYEYAQSFGADVDVCSAGRWMAAMLHGDFEAAWLESDASRARDAQGAHHCWNGEGFTGKRVILRCLHGYGDTVQMMRYAPMIVERAAELIVEVASPMIELTRHFDGVREVITWGANAPAQTPQWDVQMEVTELPYIFRTQAADLPVSTCYLKLPTSISKEVKAQSHTQGNLRVGLVWASGEWNPSRSLPARLLEPLLLTPGVEFWNLQGGPSRTEWQWFEGYPGLHEAAECAQSIVRLAALIAKLDLVITPDTLAAHLAGAVGTRAWVLLEEAADWRWQHERSDSPWYPSMQLFRQKAAGDWEGPLSVVQGELKALARENMRDQ